MIQYHRRPRRCYRVMTLLLNLPHCSTNPTPEFHLRLLFRLRDFPVVPWR